MGRLWTGRRKWEGIQEGGGNITKDPEMNMVSLEALGGLGYFEFSRCFEEHEREESTGSWSLEWGSLQDPTEPRRVSAVTVFS